MPIAFGPMIGRLGYPLSLLSGTPKVAGPRIPKNFYHSRSLDVVEKVATPRLCQDGSESECCGTASFRGTSITRGRWTYERKLRDRGFVRSGNPRSLDENEK